MAQVRSNEPQIAGRWDTMKGHLNMTIPLSCPHCRAELLTTLDNVLQEVAIQCLQCGTRVDLRSEDLPTPPLYGEVREDPSSGSILAGGCQPLITPIGLSRHTSVPGRPARPPPPLRPTSLYAPDISSASPFQLAPSPRCPGGPCRPDLLAAHVPHRLVPRHRPPGPVADRAERLVHRPRFAHQEERVPPHVAGDDDGLADPAARRGHLGMARRKRAGRPLAMDAQHLRPAVDGRAAPSSRCCGPRRTPAAGPASRASFRRRATGRRGPRPSAVADWPTRSWRPRASRPGTPAPRGSSPAQQSCGSGRSKPYFFALRRASSSGNRRRPGDRTRGCRNGS